MQANKRLLILLVLGITIGVLAVSAVAQESAAGAPLQSNFRSSEPTPDDHSSPAVKLGTVLVSLRVTVTDRSGRAIGGLKKEQFTLYQDKIEQQPSFFSDEDAPASVAIVFDTSGSMRGDKIQRAQEALARFIKTSHEDDEYFLIAFSSAPRLLLDGVRDGQAVLNQFKEADPGGNTALYDAVHLGIEKVSHGRYPKRAIILISDGEDNLSRHSLNQVCRTLQEADVVLYAIGIGDGFSPRPSRFQSSGGVVMDKLAAVSGGKAYWPGTPEKADEQFELIAVELRRQYSIGYYVSSNISADGKWHRVKVTVTAPQELSQLVVRSRGGYYAFKNNVDTGTGYPDANRDESRRN